MGDTIVRLYKCEQCGRQLFEEDINLGKACKCGSRRIRYAEPTFGRMFKFFMKNPVFLKVFWKENVCNR